MSLPPLPKELAAFAETQARHCALNDMVQAYGQQCRAAALEEAANVCEKHSGQWTTSKATARNAAYEIRSLKS